MKLIQKQLENVQQEVDKQRGQDSFKRYGIARDQDSDDDSGPRGTTLAFLTQPEPKFDPYQLAYISPPEGNPKEKGAAIFEMLVQLPEMKIKKSAVKPFQRQRPKAPEPPVAPPQALPTSPPSLVPPPLFFGKIPTVNMTQPGAALPIRTAPQASAPVISAEPQMRDLQKELTRMVPVALRRKAGPSASDRPTKQVRTDASAQDKEYAAFLAQMEKSDS